jgi:hypothetical protein
VLQEYVAAQHVRARLGDLFPDWNASESSAFLLWLAQLPLSMHRPRPLTGTHGWRAAGEIMTVQATETCKSIFKKVAGRESADAARLMSSMRLLTCPHRCMSVSSHS